MTKSQFDSDAVDRMTAALEDLQFWGQLRALELTLRLYDPDQPRVPGGQPNGGQWTGDSQALTPNDIVYNGFYHDKLRDRLANDLRRDGAIVETEILLTLPSHPPHSARIDILVQNPQTKVVYAVEIKTGDDPDFTNDQKVVYPYMQFGKSVYTLDRRILQFGLKTGEMLPSIMLKTFYEPTPGGKIFIMPTPFRSKP